MKTLKYRNTVLAFGVVAAAGFSAATPSQSDVARRDTQPRESAPKNPVSVDRAEAPDGDDSGDAAESIHAATRGVVGGKHDFSELTGRPTDACSGCHVPHIQAIRPSTSGDRDAVLELYKLGGQRKVLVPDQYMPGASSLICLSCHNGAVATSVVGSSHALLAGRRQGFDVPDGFAAKDHPIGLTYPQMEKGYRSRARVESVSGIRLPEGRVECISCHDPHNTAGVDKMLVMSNRRSALCLACHIK